MKYLLSALAVSFAVPAYAQTQCGPRADVVERLADGYGEVAQSVAIAGSGRMAEVYANLDTGTWTWTVTTPQGLMCLVASGTSYEAVDDPVQPTGERL